MKQITLDTNAYAAFKCGNADIVAIVQHTDLINISAIVLGELLAGFAVGTREKKNRQELSEFLSSSRCQLSSVDDGTAIYYAQIYKLLRKQGRPIPTNDLWIAALAMQHGHILCTLDKHFSQIDGLLTCMQLSDILP